jgi:hypothetical protein
VIQCIYTHIRGTETVGRMILNIYNPTLDRSGGRYCKSMCSAADPFSAVPVENQARHLVALLRVIVQEAKSFWPWPDPDPVKNMTDGWCTYADFHMIATSRRRLEF